MMMFALGQVQNLLCVRIASQNRRDFSRPFLQVDFKCMFPCITNLVRTDPRIRRDGVFFRELSMALRLILKPLFGGVAAQDQLELHTGESLTFGAFGSNRYVLTPFRGMPDVCAIVVNTEDVGIIVENVARIELAVRVNTSPVYSVALMEDGDLLEIGTDSFQVEVHEVSVTQLSVVNGPTSVAAVVVEPQIDFSLNTQDLRGVALRHVPVSDEWTLLDAAAAGVMSGSAMLLVNLKVAQNAGSPRKEILGPDLIADAPEEIRTENSLHAVSRGTSRERMELLKSLLEQDAVIVAWPEPGPDDAVRAMKMFSAWYLRPATLEFALQKGTRVLVESLLKPFRGLLIRPKNTPGTWALFTKADFDPLGLRIVPE
jgi:hypothetical protein